MSDAHFQRGALLLQQGRHAMAAEALRLCLAQDPVHAGAHAMLALCLAEDERWDDASAEAALAVQSDPGDAYAHYAMGTVCFRRNRRDEAHAAFAEAIALAPDEPDYRAALAQIEGARERWDACLAAADQGLALDAHHAGCLNLRALALTHLGRRDEAEQVIAGALARNPHSALAHVNQGWTLLHGNDHRQAMVHFREALRLQPDNEWARRGLVEAIKARNPLYRGMLAWFLWMSRRSPRVRWAIVVGLFLTLQALVGYSRAHPEHDRWVWPLVIALVAFAWSSWLAAPLSNLVLRLHRDGRHALSDDQRHQATLIGLILAASAFYALYAYACLPPQSWMLALLVLVLALPASGIHACDAGWPRRTMVIVCACLAVVAVGDAVAMAVIPHLSREQATALVGAIGATLNPYFIAILLSQFGANLLKQMVAKR